MRIEAYIIAWNREETIALTINYYKSFCDQITIFDNFSDDKTRDIAESMGCEVNLFGRNGVLDDAEYLKVKNNAWKKSNADWAIVVDDDEILYEKDLVFILRQSALKGHTIFKPQGISIHSDTVPRETWLDIRTGYKDKAYSKLCIFNPQAIKEIGYVYGCHEAKPTGNVIFAEDQLFLLHYCFVGGVDRLIKRWSEYNVRRQRSAINMKWNLGHRYAKTESEIRLEWKESLEKSVPLSKAGVDY